MSEKSKAAQNKVRDLTLYQEKSSDAGESFLEQRFRIGALDYAIPEHANTIWYALGGATFMALILLIISGSVIAQFYNPAVGAAHDSIRYIVEEVPFGWFVQGIHHWAAQVVMVTLLLHVGRVLFTGSYKKPREFTYYFGLLVFFLMLSMIFTGTIVKWDQEGFEALSHFVGLSGMLGAIGSVFSATFAPMTHILSRIYSLHISTLPLAILSILVIHFFLIKVLKISPLPWKSAAEQKLTASFVGHLRLLAKVGLGVLGLVMVLALVFGPPLAEAPQNVEQGVKPPWMFLWLYALENYMGLAGVLYGTGALFLSLGAFPLLDRGESRDPRKRPVAMGLLAAIIIALLILTVIGYLSPQVVHTGGH